MLSNASTKEQSKDNITILHIPSYGFESKGGHDFSDSDMTTNTTVFGESVHDCNSSVKMETHVVSHAPTPKWLLLWLGLIPVWILTGNLLVLLAVLLNRNLRTLSNWVVASLAATDFLVALMVVPLGIYHVINGRWDLGFIPCLIWTGSDVFLSTASILHLVAIAIHRYLGISNPLHFRNHADKRHILALLLPAWLVSLVITLPLIIQGLRDERHVLRPVQGAGPQCGIFDPTFAIYSSTVSFFVPLGIMIFADIGSVYALRRTTKVNQTSMRRSKSQHARFSVGLGSKKSHIGYRLATNEIGFDTDANNGRQQVVYYNGRAARSGPEVGFFTGTAVSISMSASSSINGEPAVIAQESALPQKLSKFTRTSRKANSRERRAERTLIWVFVCFIALWLPFFCTNLSFGCCPSCDIPPYIFVTFTWLGYISSGVNPCIYTFLNKDFRNAFKKILIC